MSKLINFNTDNIFVIGDGHNICEDYAHSGVAFDKYPYVIISDGCSASYNTDIGSRVMVRAFVSILENFNDMEHPISIIRDDEMDIHRKSAMVYDCLYKALAYKVNTISDAMGLHVGALDATVRMAIIIEGYLFMFHYGDGLTILNNHTTGDTENMWYTNYPYNAPFYPNYSFMDYISTTQMTQKYASMYEKSLVDCDGEEQEVYQYVTKKRNFYSMIDLKTMDTGVYTISVMSDGIETFFESNKNITTGEVVDNILAFKNFQGIFVQRKVRMYLNTLAKRNIKHYDDVSVASIMFEIGEDDGAVGDSVI